MCLGIPPLRIKMMLESNPLKSTMLGGLGVCASLLFLVIIAILLIVIIHILLIVIIVFLLIVIITILLIVVIVCIRSLAEKRPAANQETKYDSQLSEIAHHGP